MIAKHPFVKWAAIGYLSLWALTATVGKWNVDNHFDREFATGTAGVLLQPIEQPAKRINLVDYDNLLHPGNDLPASPWRSRTSGTAIAPFLIIDEAAWLIADDQGFGCKRIVVWFFGLTWWHPIVPYWAA